MVDENEKVQWPVLKKLQVYVFVGSIILSEQ